jgi:tetrahydromethanopterin S-methyltransferase subunit E
LVALIPGLMIVGILVLMNWVVKRARDDRSEMD